MRSVRAFRSIPAPSNIPVMQRYMRARPDTRQRRRRIGDIAGRVEKRGVDRTLLPRLVNSRCSPPPPTRVRRIDFDASEDAAYDASEPATPLKQSLSLPELRASPSNVQDRDLRRKQRHHKQNHCSAFGSIRLGHESSSRLSGLPGTGASPSPLSPLHHTCTPASSHDTPETTRTQHALVATRSLPCLTSNTSKNTNGRNQNRIQVQQRGQAGTRGDHNHGGKALSAWQQLQVTAKLKVIRVASVMLAARAMQQVCANNRQQARLKNMAFADSRGLAALVVQGLWKKYMLKKVAHIGPNTLRIMKNYAWKAKFKILCRRRVRSAKVSVHAVALSGGSHGVGTWLRLRVCVATHGQLCSVRELPKHLRLWRWWRPRRGNVVTNVCV